MDASRGLKDRIKTGSGMGVVWNLRDTEREERPGYAEEGTLRNQWATTEVTP